MSFRILFTTALIIGLTVVSGLLHGKLTLRWETPDSSDLVSLESIPETIGPWQMTRGQDISNNAIYALRADEWVYRSYSNTETGQRVNIAIVGGPQGPLCVHLPEICYTAQKYQEVRSRERVLLENPAGGEDEFWSVIIARQ